MIIVIMTGTKLYGIMYPMKVIGNKYNIKKAFINVSLTFILCAFINIHFLFSHSIIVENLNDVSQENQTIKENNRTIKTHNICANVIWFDFYEIFNEIINNVKRLPFDLFAFNPVENTPKLCSLCSSTIAILL